MGPLWLLQLLILGSDKIYLLETFIFFFFLNLLNSASQEK